jgi:hypothetical protein
MIPSLARATVETAVAQVGVVVVVRESPIGSSDAKTKLPTKSNQNAKHNSHSNVTRTSTYA